MSSSGLFSKTWLECSLVSQKTTTALSYQRLDDFWAVFSEGELSVYVSNFVVCLLKISTQEIINFIDG